MKQSWLGSLKLKIQSYVLKTWYPPLLGFLAAIDHFVMVIPTDALLIGAIIAAPKRWLSLVLWLTIGSVLGGTILAGLIQIHGVSFLEWLSPGIHDSSYWKHTVIWVNGYGLWALFVVAMLPVFQHPAIAMIALAERPLPLIALAILAGRVVKYGVLSWLATSAPQVLFKAKSAQE